MKLDDLAPPAGAKRNKKRIGRGCGSGWGKTAAKGNKGQKARSGGGVPPWFEGGQMPLQRRVPKRGFTNMNRTVYNVVGLDDLARFKDSGETVGPEQMVAAGLIRNPKIGVKLLANGTIDFPVSVQVHKASKAAIEQVQAAGGRIELIGAGEVPAEAPEVAGPANETGGQSPSGEEDGN